MLKLILMGQVKKLPREIREHVYEFIVMPWAPLEQFPVTDNRHEESAVALARRNKVPRFKNEASSNKNSENENEEEEDVDDNNPWSAEASRQTLFMQRCALLDYFKKFEYKNIVDFPKVLEMYEKKIFKNTSNSIKSCGEPQDLDEIVNLD